MHRARRAEAGLTEEVRRRWGGGKRPAQRHSVGGWLRWGGGVLGGGPAARGRGEGGNYGRGVGAEEKTWCRENNPAGGGNNTLLKGGGIAEGAEESWVMRGGLEEGGPGSHRRGQLVRRGTVGSGPAAARVSAQWRAAPGR
jgi:hypothetical protein